MKMLNCSMSSPKTFRTLKNDNWPSIQKHSWWYDRCRCWCKEKNFDHWKWKKLPRANRFILPKFIHCFLTFFCWICQYFLLKIEKKKLKETCSNLVVDSFYLWNRIKYEWKKNIWNFSCGMILSIQCHYFLWFYDFRCWLSRMPSYGNSFLLIFVLVISCWFT